MFVSGFLERVEHYPDDFTMLYQRPQADMAGEWDNNSYLNLLVTRLVFEVQV